MPTLFEQQRELIMTFRSVVRSLLAVPIGLPILFEDLSGDLMRSRVRVVTSRLVELGLITETKETKSGNHFKHLVWRVIDLPARQLLSRIVDSNEQISQLLWPDEEVTSTTLQEEEKEEEPLVEVTVAESTQDPVAIVAQVLESFNDRIAKMEQRQEQLATSMESLLRGVRDSMAQYQVQLVIGTSSITKAINDLAVKTKPYDDTELLLAMNEQTEVTKAVRETLAHETAAHQALAGVTLKVLDVIKNVDAMMSKLAEEGIQARNDQMIADYNRMVKAFMKMTEAFKEWGPAMTECITGLKIVNKNHLAAGEEMNGMLMTVLQAISANARGEKFEVKATPITHAPLRSRRAQLPGLSAMMAKKDLEKPDGLHPFTATLSESSAANVQELEREKFTLGPDNVLRRPDGTARNEEKQKEGG
jgi:hypothetical protein